MIVQPSDIIAALKRRWDETPALAVLVPGGIHQGKVPQRSDGSAVAEPYGKVDCAEKERQQNSSTTMIQVFTLTLSIWSQQGVENAGDIGRTIDLMFDRSRAGAELYVVGADRVIDLLDLPTELTLDDKTREATDQIVTSRRWEMLVQATRV